MSAEELPSVEILRLEPGDIIVATLPERVPPSQAADVLLRLRERFPAHDVLAVGGGVTISVTRSASA